MLTLIAACGLDGAIGRNGTIPWDAPEDLAAFKRETNGGALVMGRLTWESLPVRPLPGRLNIVVTSGSVDGAHCVRTPLEALAMARDLGWHRAYGIGGAGIYAALLPLSHRLLLTRVNVETPDADTFFPSFVADDWQVSSQSVVRVPAPHCLQVEMLRRRLP